MTKNTMHRMLLAATWLSLASTVSAQVYKWTDAAGTVHYSETPPSQGMGFKQLKTATSAQALVTSNAPASSSSNNGTASGTVPLANTPENRKALCAELKSNLAALGGQASVVLQQGNKQSVLNDAQRKQQTDATQAQIQQYCQSQ